MQGVDPVVACCLKLDSHNSMSSSTDSLVVFRLVNGLSRTGPCKGSACYGASVCLSGAESRLPTGHAFEAHNLDYFKLVTMTRPPIGS